MKTIFLDLDGTLTDPAPGITRSVIHALTALGMPAPSEAELTWVIGPALLDSFARLGVPDPDEALRLYRERFSTIGLFENTLFPEIPGALETLSQRYRLCLATAKPHAFATRITAHFGLDRFLSAQFGPELDGTRNDKGELLAHAIDQLGADPAECVMVGDRHHDIDAATATGMRSLGVLWGYGSAAELSGATELLAERGALAATLTRMLG